MPAGGMQGVSLHKQIAVIRESGALDSNAISGFSPYAIEEAKLFAPQSSWSAAETRDAVAFASAYKRQARDIKKYSLPGADSPDSNGWTVIINAIIALPDAYLALVQRVIPHGSLIVQLTLIVMALLFVQLVWVRMTAEKEVEPVWLIAVFLLLPLAVSFAAFLLLKTAIWAASFFGKWLIAPAFTVTATAGIAPFLSWASGIIAEHHAGETSIKLAARLLLKEAGEK